MYNLENVFLLKLVNIVIKFNFRWHAFIPFQMGVRTSVIKSKAKSRTVRVFVSQMAYFFEEKKINIRFIILKMLICFYTYHDTSNTWYRPHDICICQYNILP